MTADGVVLARLIDALRPWHEKIVFVGGWAHRLHCFHPDATVPSYQPIVTRDVDVAFDASRKMSGNIAHALKDAGFTETLSGENVPPVSHYALGDENKGFYVGPRFQIRSARVSAAEPKRCLEP